MRLSIIPADGTVYKDGKAYGGIDLSWIPDFEEKKIHAVQWFDEDDDGVGEGEIEFVGSHQNLIITTFGIDGVCSFEKSIHQWNEKRDEEESLIQQRLEAEERLKKEMEEASQMQFLDFNKTHIPSIVDEEDQVDDGDDEEDLYYDIEELLKEI